MPSARSELFFEPGLQAWAEGSNWIVTVSSWMYVNAAFAVTTFLIWLYIARNHAFYFVRNMFLVAMGLALVGYMAYPTAPPRFLRVGLQRLGRQLRGRERGPERQRALQPVRRRPEHARRVRADDRRAGDHAREAPLGKVLWAIYPLRRDLRGDGHRQPLLARRRARRARGRGVAYAAYAAFARARPDAWAWRTGHT